MNRKASVAVIAALLLGSLPLKAEDKNGLDLTVGSSDVRPRRDVAGGAGGFYRRTVLGKHSGLHLSLNPGVQYLRRGESDPVAAGLTPLSSDDRTSQASLDYTQVLELGRAEIAGPLASGLFDGSMSLQGYGGVGVGMARRTRGTATYKTYDLSAYVPASQSCSQTCTQWINDGKDGRTCAEWSSACAQTEAYTMTSSESEEIGRAVNSVNGPVMTAFGGLRLQESKSGVSVEFERALPPARLGPAFNIYKIGYTRDW